MRLAHLKFRSSSSILLLIIAVSRKITGASPTSFGSGAGGVGGNNSDTSSTVTLKSSAFVRTSPQSTTKTTTAAPQQQMKLHPSSAKAFVKRSFSKVGTTSFPGSTLVNSMESSSASSLLGATTTAPANGEAATTCNTPMYNFYNALSPSWLDQLSPETPQNYERSLKRASRQGHPGRPVYNGHYVEVRPQPLLNPKLVIHSPQLLSELKCFSPDEHKSEEFVKYFSGDVEGAFTSNYNNHNNDPTVINLANIRTWATPYALSIMGKRMTSNCPYGTGEGYGDGRAMGIGEILVPQQQQQDGHQQLGNSRFELQLKGAGQTPFCRGADGRAVLRSSIREFLASEAMHHLGISTTRALCLIVSDGPNGNVSRRPWYSTRQGGNDDQQQIPTMDDPRLAKFDTTRRREIINQLRASTRSDPDMMVEEQCAITTRVAPSFVRIGHLDLFARRVDELLERAGDNDDDDDEEEESIAIAPVEGSSSGRKMAFGLPTKENDGKLKKKKRKIAETSTYRELEDMMWHACYREYYDTAYLPHYEQRDAISASIALMEGSMVRIAAMVAGWVRVGFVQGNFNADNCLVGGRTMDYGPFGFVDVYHPLAAKWTGSGEHFGFMNQPNAGYANFAVLLESLMPIIDVYGGDVEEFRKDMLTKAQSVFSDAVDKAMRAKMGLIGDHIPDAVDNLWGEMEPLLRLARGDWNLFWRQLTYVAAKYSPATRKSDDVPLDYDDMITILLGEGVTNPFYDQLTDENRGSIRAWIEKWHFTMVACYQNAIGQSNSDITPPEEIMRLSNPKFTLREWMLVDAYTKADSGKSGSNGGDYSGVHDLFRLCLDPYSEGTAEDNEKYYRRAPDESLRKGGTAFMS